MLLTEISSLDIGDFNKECVKSRLQDSRNSSFKQFSKISDKNISREEVKALNNLVKKNTHIFKKQTKIMILLFLTEVIIFQN